MVNLKVSIIIAAYNVDRYVEACIISAISQTLSDIEIICINDGSTDGTSEILSQFEGQDKRVRIINNNKNRGLSYVRNLGINSANGEYLWFIDGDDRINGKNAVAELYDAAEKDTLDILAFNSLYEYETSNIKENYSFFEQIRPRENTGILDGKDFFTKQVMHNEFRSAVPFYLFRKEWLISNNLIFQDTYFEDQIFLPQVLFYAKKVKYIQKEYYIYYRREDSITTDYRLDNLRIPCAMKVAHCLIEDAYRMRLGEETITAFIKYINELLHAMMFDYINCLKTGREVEIKDFRLRMWFYALLEQRYPLISSKLDAKVIQRIYSAESIIIYGAGEVAMSVKRLLKDLKINKYKVAVTQNKTPGIYELGELMDETGKALLIIAVTGEKKYEMDEYASSLGYASRMQIA